MSTTIWGNITWIFFHTLVHKIDESKFNEQKKNGMVPVEGNGRKLYENMTELIRSNGDELVPVWSGDFRPNKSKESWMGLEIP